MQIILEDFKRLQSVAEKQGSAEREFDSIFR